MFSKFLCICLFLNVSTKGASNSLPEGFFYNAVNFRCLFLILSHSNLQVPFEVLVTSFSPLCFCYYLNVCCCWFLILVLPILIS